MADLEAMVRDRGRLILAIAVTFAIWQGGDIVAQLSLANTRLFTVASIVMIIGAIAYSIAALLLLRFYLRVKRVGAANTLRDDWNRLTAGLALQSGFFFVIGLTALLYGASLFWTFPITPALQAIMVVGISGSLLAFVIYDERGAH